MQAVAFLKEVGKLRRAVITINDIAKIIGKNKAYARTYVSRQIKKSILHKVEKGKYSTSDDPFEIASNLAFPAYISFISAYSIYGLTTQTPAEVQVVALRSKKPVFMGNTRVVFIKFRKDRLFGYKREKFRNSYIFIAEQEKAIVDSLYLPEHCPISESYEALKGGANIEKLVNYALRMNSIITIKRLGYLLELHGHNIYKKVLHRLNKRYDLLNPSLPKAKKKSLKWKLNINEEMA